MIAIGCDHGGFALKQEVMRHLDELGLAYKDFGTYSEESCDYPIYGEAVARAVAGGECERGILICGTGIGMALTADKVPGIRAAVIQSPQFAHLFREHNNGLVIGLSGRFTPFDVNCAIVDEFLGTEFAGGRHAIRVEKIMREDDPTFEGVGEDFGA